MRPEPLSARETARYILFVLWLLLAVCGFSLVARHFGGQ